MSTSTAKQMNLSQPLIAEIQHEAATTRTILERIPADKFDYKPHEKSMEFRRLAVHVAEMFDWIETTLTSDELDFAKMDYKPAEPATTEELVALLDKYVANAVAALENAADESFFENWTLKNGETTYFTMPKIQVIRSFSLNHIYHHRGQLSVYLRLNEIPVPPIYGPSADEGQM
jgi:uncharacterized damage-inducible protein DinB